MVVLLKGSKVLGNDIRCTVINQITGTILEFSPNDFLLQIINKKEEILIRNLLTAVKLLLAQTWGSDRVPIKDNWLIKCHNVMLRGNILL